MRQISRSIFIDQRAVHRLASVILLPFKAVYNHISTIKMSTLLLLEADIMPSSFAVQGMRRNSPLLMNVSATSFSSDKVEHLFSHVIGQLISLL